MTYQHAYKITRRSGALQVVASLALVLFHPGCAGSDQKESGGMSAGGVAQGSVGGANAQHSGGVAATGNSGTLVVNAGGNISTSASSSIGSVVGTGGNTSTLSGSASGNSGVPAGGSNAITGTTSTIAPTAEGRWTNSYCTSGEYIGYSAWCDGKVDCSDGEDESTTTCTNKCAFEHEYWCAASQRCVVRCDAVNDCGDGGDELACTQYCSTIGGFLCSGTEQCLKEVSGLSKRASRGSLPLCDGFNDCANGADEVSCAAYCSAADGFLCPGSSTCLSMDARCDGSGDCTDDADEGSCSSYCSAKSGYLCADSSWCIETSRLCDGRQDCSSDEDPARAPCSTACAAREGYWCEGTQKCIESRQFCDGQVDCAGGGDEANCQTVCAVRKLSWCYCATDDTCLYIKDKSHCSNPADVAACSSG